MRSIFVTGTDTGVGKSRVAAALAAAFHRAGRRVAVMKPAETGCVVATDGSRIPEDAELLRRACGRDLDPRLVCPFRYEAPASPLSAAELAGEPPPDAATLVAAYNRLAADTDLLLVEGAGGLLVPLAPGLLMADLARQLAPPLLIVARTGLGTINHTLLTVEAARHRGLHVLGVVLNQTQPPAGPEEALVARRLREHLDLTVYGPLPHGLDTSSLSISALAEIADRHLDPQGLWEALQARVEEPAPEPLASA